MRKKCDLCANRNCRRKYKKAKRVYVWFADLGGAFDKLKREKIWEKIYEEIRVEIVIEEEKNR